jgi:flagellar biogenesis protein FliO
MMIAFIVQLSIVTVLVIGFLLMVYFLLKQNPKLLQGFQLSPLLPLPSHNDHALLIESRLPLDGRKSLMVIRAGEERYLIGTTLERIDAITRMGDAGTAGMMASFAQQNNPMALPVDTLNHGPQPAFQVPPQANSHANRQPNPNSKPMGQTESHPAASGQTQPVGLSRFASPPLGKASLNHGVNSGVNSGVNTAVKASATSTNHSHQPGTTAGNTFKSHLNVLQSQPKPAQTPAMANNAATGTSGNTRLNRRQAFQQNLNRIS